MAASLSRRLFGSFFLVLAAAVGLIAWQARGLEGKLTEQRQREWVFRELGLAAAALPADALARADRVALDAWCDRMGAAAQVRVTLIGSDGALLGDSDVREDSLSRVENHAARPEVREARATGRGWSARRSATVGQDLWYGAIPVGVGSPPRPVLRLAVPQADLLAERRSQTRLIFLSLLVVLLSALLLSAWAVSILSRRLDAALQAAHRMSQGELGARAPTLPADEIGNLGTALNHMAARLDQRLLDLARERDEREHDLSRVKHLENIRQEFVANVSHELRTPLTLIKGFAETLLDGGLEDRERRREFVERIERHADRLHLIVEDLLQLAKLEQPGVSARRQEVDLQALARSSAAAFEGAAARKGLAIQIAPWPGPGPVAVPADPSLLERALFNLLDNAVKYTESGAVTLALGSEAGAVWCEVRDTGPGIPPEHLERIFERFYRVDQGRSRDLGGTGLGLSIVKHAVELSGGTVSATSTLGRGTTFRIVFRAAPPA